MFGLMIGLLPRRLTLILNLPFTPSVIDLGVDFIWLALSTVVGLLETFSVSTEQESEKIVKQNNRIDIHLAISPPYVFSL